MYIGVSLVLLAFGAILYFAVEDNLQGIDLPMVGLILMVVGLLGMVVSLVVFNQHRDRRVDPRDPR
ncbi:DUF6458 family protein [Aeromicrobium sp.]|uniref:DUF6458 family protein n=1 Tax=Aeromicrobium sp. TaxID=1871063 RepID=UPI003D6C12D4